MLQFVQTYSKETFAVVAVVVGFILNRVFRLRPKLLFSVTHSSNLPVAQPLLDNDGKVIQQNQLVRTASIYAENGGLQPATNVEFTFNWKPPIYTVNPGRAYSVEDTEAGRWVLRLGSLAPGEFFTIEILSINQDLPYLSSMRCDETAGKLIPMLPQRQYSSWFNRSVIALLLLGSVTALYLVGLLIEWLAS